MEAASFYSGGASLTAALSEDTVTTPRGRYSGGHSRVQAYSTPDHGYSTPVPPISDPYSHNFVVNQKLDTIVSEFREQKKMLLEAKKETAQLSEGLSYLKTEVSKLKDQLEQSSSGVLSAKVRKKIPLDLSAAVKALHDKAPERNKFDGSKSYQSEANTSAKEYLLENLTEKFKDTQSPKRIKRAVHRYYESRRRLFNDSQPERAVTAKNNRKKSKKRTLQKQLYDRRTKFIKTDKERERWSKIDYQYMTEESDASDASDVINQHKPVWRSEALSQLIKKLDSRGSKSKANARGGFKAKRRELSTPSLLGPPTTCPPWAVQASLIHPSTQTEPTLSDTDDD